MNKFFSAFPLIIAYTSLSAFAQVHGEHGGNGGNGNATKVPSLSIPAINVSDLSWRSFVPERAEAVTKSMAFNPILEVNTNRGTLTSGFEIALPPNGTKTTSLRLRYNSNQATNKGLGIGFDLDLPEILFHDRATVGHELSLSGKLGNSALLETKESIAGVMPLVQKLAGLYLPKTGTGALKTFRPDLEENFTLVISIEGQGLIALCPQDDHHVFNRDGQLVAVVSRDGNALRLNWENGILKDIHSSVGDRLSLSYSAELQKWPIYNRRGLHRLPKGLISTTLKARNGSSKKLLIKNDGEYLVSAAWSKAQLPVFQASYDSVENDKILGLPPVAPSSEKSTYVFEAAHDRPILKEVITDEENQDLVTYYDINGDAREDKLIFLTRAFNEKIKEISKSITYATTVDDSTSKCTATPTISLADLQAKINAVPLPLEVHIGAMDSKNSLSYVKDESLSLPDIVTGVPKIVVETSLETISGCTVTVFKLKAMVPSLKFLDLNGDNRTDLVFCPNDSSLEEKTITEAKNTHSNLALSILRLYGDKNLATEAFTSTFDSTGSTPVAYLSAVNRSKLKEAMAYQDMTYKNHVLGSYSWVRSSPSFTCHQHSIALDLNGDGLTDIFNGKASFLLSTHGALPLRLSEDNIRGLFRPANDVTFDRKRYAYSFLDANGDGQFEMYQANQIMRWPRSNAVEIIQKDKTERIHLLPRQKLLQSVYSSFGGRMQIKYRLEQGQLTVEKKTTLTESGDVQKESTFSYGKDLLDPITGAFVGYSKTVEETRYATSMLAPRRVERQFYRDDGPRAVLFLSRARLHGQKLSEKTLSLDGEKIFELTIYKLDGAKISGDRLLPFTSERKHQAFNADGQTVSKEVLEKLSFPTWIQSEGHTYGPKTLTRKVQTRTGLFNVYNDHDQSTYTTSFEFKTASYTLVQKLKTVMRGDTGTLTSQVAHDYDDHGHLLATTQGNRKVSQKYDSAGRLTAQTNEWGGVFHLGYDKEGILPTRLTGPTGDYQLTYSPFSNSVTQIVLASGHALSIERDDLDEAQLVRLNGNEIFQRLPLETRNCELPFPCFEKKLTVMDRDQQRDYVLDDFGVYSSQVEDFQDQRLVSSSRNVIDGKVITEFAPTFEDGGSEPKVRLKTLFDVLGRRTTIKVAGPQSRTIRYQYDSNCQSQTVFDELIESRCTGHEDEVTSIEEMGAFHSFSYATDGLLRSMDKGNFNWSRNVEGDSLGISGTINRNRRIEYSPSEYRYESGRIVSLDPMGRIEKVHGIQGGSHLSENRTYDSRGNKIKTNFRNQALSEKTSYNNLSLPIESENGFRSQRATYDQWGQLLSEEIRGASTYSLSYTNEYGVVTSIHPYVTKITYDAFKLPRQVEYANGLRLTIDRNPITGTIEQTSYTSHGAIVFQEIVNQNRMGLIGSIKTYFNDRLGGKDSVSKVFTYKGQLPLFPDAIPGVRNSRGELTQLKDSSLKFEDGLVAKIIGEKDQYKFFYDGEGIFKAACKGTETLEGDLSGCFVRLNNDEVLSDGLYLRRVSLGDIPLGVIFRDKFYPVLFNHHKAITGVLSPNGQTIMFYRDFTAEGRKSVLINDRYKASAAQKKFATEFERILGWSYGRLWQLPWSELQRKNIYQSASRTYLASEMAWASPDPLFIWKPEVLFEKKGNWNALSYAGGDPVNHVDPSGNNILFAGAVMGTAAVIAGAAIGVAGVAAVTAVAMVAAPAVIGCYVVGSLMVASAPTVSLYVGAQMELNPATTSVVTGVFTGIFEKMTGEQTGIPDVETYAGITSEVTKWGLDFMNGGFQSHEIDHSSINESAIDKHSYWGSNPYE